MFDWPARMNTYTGLSAAAAVATNANHRKNVRVMAAMPRWSIAMFPVSVMENPR
jgi:hypothetical protein